MIKIIKEDKASNEPKPYPKLMKSSKYVILFSGPKIGTVISTTGTTFLPGYQGREWSMPAFIDYDGKITLENE